MLGKTELQVLLPIQHHISPVYTLPTYVLKIHFNIMHLHLLVFPKTSFNSCHQNFVWISSSLYTKFLGKQNSEMILTIMETW